MRKCIVFACQGIEPCQANADAGTRRPQVRVRSPNLAIRKCIVFACQGIEPCQANADAGTRRPQVRTRFPQVRTRFLLVMKKINDRLTEKINDRLMMINVQKKGSRSEPYLILFCLFTFHRFQIPNDRVVIGEGDGVVDAYSEGLEVRGAEYIVNAHVDSIAIE